MLIVSAGTNGHPAATTQFKADVRRVLALAGRKRCVIWANIVRPPYQGVSYTRLNRALAELDRAHANLVVFDWARMVARHPGVLSSDGVHVEVPFYRVAGEGARGSGEALPLITMSTPHLPPTAGDPIGGWSVEDAAAADPPPASDETATAPPARPRRPPAPRRPRGSTRGRARQVTRSSIVAVALLLSLLLNAPGLHKSASAQPPGWQRDVALAVTGALDSRQRSSLARPPACGGSRR